MIVAVTGGRDLVVTRAIAEAWERAITELWTAAGQPLDITIRHGGCPTGLDAWIAGWCVANSVPVEEWPADWARHGRAAGPIRNREMLRGRHNDNRVADVLVTFPGNRGTHDCMRAAVQYKIPIRPIVVH